MTVLKKEIHQAWRATCNLVALLTQRDLFTRAHQAEKGISSCKFPTEGKSAGVKTLQSEILWNPQDYGHGNALLKGKIKLIYLYFKKKKHLRETQKAQGKGAKEKKSRLKGK